jgi:leader peptidase (prepilin peptidase)/N-methyltransferase
MGHGDFKLLAGLGAWLGWKMVPIVLFFATITGLIYASFLIVFKKIGKDSLIPFAPFLSLAGWILMFYAERIIDGYINSFV